MLKAGILSLVLMVGTVANAANFLEARIVKDGAAVLGTEFSPERRGNGLIIRLSGATPGGSVIIEGLSNYEIGKVAADGTFNFDLGQHVESSRNAVYPNRPFYDSFIPRADCVVTVYVNYSADINKKVLTDCPILSATQAKPTATNITSSGFTVNWKTSVPTKGAMVRTKWNSGGCCSQVNSYRTETETTNHSIVVTDLVPTNSTFKVSVSANDVYGRPLAVGEVDSAPANQNLLVTLKASTTTPPVAGATKPTASSITKTSFVINWTSPVPSTATIKVRRGTGAVESFPSSATGTSHSVTITGRASRTDYKVSVSATDSTGKQIGWGDVNSTNAANYLTVKTTK